MSSSHSVSDWDDSMLQDATGGHVSPDDLEDEPRYDSDPEPAPEIGRTSSMKSRSSAAPPKRSSMMSTVSKTSVRKVSFITGVARGTGSRRTSFRSVLPFGQEKEKMGRSVDAAIANAVTKLKDKEDKDARDKAGHKESQPARACSKESSAIRNERKCRSPDSGDSLAPATVAAFATHSPDSFAEDDPSVEKSDDGMVMERSFTMERNRCNEECAPPLLPVDMEEAVSVHSTSDSDVERKARRPDVQDSLR